MNRDYAIAVGQRLRSVREQKRLSLHKVEALSGKEFKASVLGAYERGERVISVPRLQRLARFYSTSIEHLLPDTERGSRRPSSDVRIDLAALETPDAPESARIERFIAAIRMARADVTGGPLTVRRDDVRVLAAAFGQTPEQFAARVEHLGANPGER